MIKNNKQGGYTLLFAVLTATLVMGVAIFIVNLSRKQHELAVSARNSIYSFYAADSGIECAVNESNWAVPGFASTSSSVGAAEPYPGGGTLHCGDDQVTLVQVSPPQIYPTSIIENGTAGNEIRQWSGYVSLPFKFNDDDSVSSYGCVQITRTTGAEPGTGKPMTIIDSRGYNLCTSVAPPAPDTTNTGTVERALRLIQRGVW